MDTAPALDLHPNLTPGSSVNAAGESAWRLAIPATPQSAAKTPYRLAQIDDYTGLARRAFRWRPPLTLSLRARASGDALPGTWGFGFWNDPFSLSLGLGGGVRRFPALPNAAWFFIASPPNYLSFRDDLPAVGALAATFRSPVLPAPLLALGALFFPLLSLPPAARWFRRFARRFIRQEAARLQGPGSPGLRLDAWHSYAIAWHAEGVVFSVDGVVVLDTPVAPPGPLGLVLWIDNQYAALPPDGRMAFGALPLPVPAAIELSHLQVTT